MYKLFIIVSALILSCLPALAQNGQPQGTEIIQSKINNWQTLNDRRVCAVSAFYTNDFSISIMKVKRTNTWWILLQDRDPTRNVMGRTVALSVGGHSLGSGIFSETEAFGVPLSASKRAAIAGSHILRARGQTVTFDFSLAGSAAAENWIRACDAAPPVSVNQRPLLNRSIIPDFSTQVNPVLK